MFTFSIFSQLLFPQTTIIPPSVFAHKFSDSVLKRKENSLLELSGFFDKIHDSVLSNQKKRVV